MQVEVIFLFFFFTCIITCHFLMERVKMIVVITIGYHLYNIYFQFVSSKNPELPLTTNTSMDTVGCTVQSLLCEYCGCAMTPNLCCETPSF